MTKHRVDLGPLHLIAYRVSGRRLRFNPWRSVLGPAGVDVHIGRLGVAAWVQLYPRDF